MKFSELPADVQATAAQTLKEILIQSEEPTEQLAQVVKDAFIALYSPLDELPQHGNSQAGQ
ncbi:hypothetical protein [Serratia rubidaea]|uniref:Uncharacterized protein n=1 Tax=Serratia rubidaea TaxID=61652 RepID=A0ABS0MH83_SERRU|nr:hypothetical protein [Serratia rubidaea]MBH1930889.1 hypothetical protein [Serratia rubidaea]